MEAVSEKMDGPQLACKNGEDGNPSALQRRRDASNSMALSL